MVDRFLYFVTIAAGLQQTLRLPEKVSDLEPMLECSDTTGSALCDHVMPLSPIIY
jgi:hypothetical protein